MTETTPVGKYRVGQVFHRIVEFNHLSCHYAPLRTYLVLGFSNFPPPKRGEFIFYLIALCVLWWLLWIANVNN